MTVNRVSSARAGAGTQDGGTLGPLAAAQQVTEAMNAEFAPPDKPTHGQRSRVGTSIKDRRRTGFIPAHSTQASTRAERSLTNEVPDAPRIVSDSDTRRVLAGVHTGNGGKFRRFGLTPPNSSTCTTSDLPGFFVPIIPRKLAPRLRGDHDKRSIHRRADGRQFARG